jgi:magnesium and cobalt transporter
MSEDQSSNGSGPDTWMGRISKAFSSEPRDRGELKELIQESFEKGILDAEAVAMIEGVLAVSEMQVRDAMLHVRIWSSFPSISHWMNFYH